MFSQSKNDIPILMLSVAALLLAAFLSMVTISSHSREEAAASSKDPYQMAETAARAGVEAATWHAKCHGRTVRGNIGKRFYINGATYEASWSDVNTSDSTVTIKSVGYADLESKREYSIEIEAKVKLDFMPYHKNEILTGYYTNSRPEVVNTSSR